MIISFLIFLATIGFVWHRLYKTNMEIPESAERIVPDGENWNFFDKVQIVIRPAPP